ncbi:MAG: O-antigen ligase family protein, partial [Anaerolineae bacterium]|nr:O-antigen ligase family protein [Anaerolineae bacterium]
MTMRVQRYGFIFLACFLVLISGAYYYQVAALRLAHHVVVTLALLGYTLWAWRRGGIPASPLTLPLLAAILLWMAAAALGVDARVGLENAWFPISHAVITLCLIDLIRRGRGGLVVETQLLLAAAVALFALVHLGSWYFGWGVVPGTAVGWAEVTAVAPLPLVLPMIYMPVGVSTWLAAYTAPLVLLSFAYGLSGRGAARVGLWALAAALLIALLATGSRGGLIALAAGAAAFVGLRVLPLSFLPLTPDPSPTQAGRGETSLMPGARDHTPSPTSVPLTPDRSPMQVPLTPDPSPTQAGRGEILSPPRPLWERGSGGEGRRLLPLAAAALIVAAALGAVFLISGSAARFTGDALRFELWRGALAVGADHPLLGVGTGMFGRVYREYRVFGGVYDNRLGTAHNAYLNTFAETGIVGAALMIAFGIVIVRAFWRRRRALGAPGQGRIRVERLRLEGAFAALFGFGVQSLFDTFVVTPLALLTAVLVVLVVVEPGAVVGPVRRLRWAAPALALLIAIYGVGQVVSDSLYGQF